MLSELLANLLNDLLAGALDGLVNLAALLNDRIVRLAGLLDRGIVGLDNVLGRPLDLSGEERAEDVGLDNELVLLRRRECRRGRQLGETSLLLEQPGLRLGPLLGNLLGHLKVVLARDRRGLAPDSLDGSLGASEQVAGRLGGCDEEVRREGVKRRNQPGL